MNQQANNHLRKSLNYAYLKANTPREAIDKFKTQAIKLLDSIEENKKEEFYKTNLIYFLNETYYKDNHYINVKDSNDLVIHNDKKPTSSVGVIIEVKRPSNKAEMVSCDNLNKKALQELVLYYLRERISHKNRHLKHLIITTINEWFIFDARIFESCFAENKQLVKDFTAFENGTLAGHKTSSFYDAIAKPVIEACKEQLTFTYFNLADYQPLLENTDKENDKTLIPLFKVLSPEHLLKLSFSNDANSLNQEFYNELLHIIGLEEIKEGGKKLIKRKKESERHLASFLEQIINEVDSLGKINRLDNAKQFGKTLTEKLEHIAIELSITWINRVLFLKLLESQLLSYHNNDKDYQFLNCEKINCFADLNHLFFQVLAKKSNLRNEKLKQLFPHVPYLNSSLFELTDLEDKTLVISHLSRLNIPVFSETVLKNQQGFRLKGELDSLSYLFQFLEAYDFSSEGKEIIQEENKTLITASVLGLIFEKINGYKDGSYFTPSIITMYMSRETMRLAVVQKFNEHKGWQCQTFNDLKSIIKIDNRENRKEANDIINSIKVCDPAVGSGHFLVSVLNEFITIKSELSVLVDNDFTGLSDWKVSIHNDELKVIRTDDNSIQFEYNPKSKESYRIQKTLFHEKQTIIENCLFGVDINPNSVKLCRLRLWIELLKNAYYNDDGNLETLPNIDINIQIGNSLVSRFKLTEELEKHQDNIEAYKKAIYAYQNTPDKDKKLDIEKRIAELKGFFFKGLIDNSKDNHKLKQLSNKLVDLNHPSLIEETPKEKKEKERAIQKIHSELHKLKNELNSTEFYENAFEWRFVFPEALNKEGDFVGFDVIIGNPPYIFSRNSKEKGLTEESKSYFYENFELAEYQVNLYPLFIELGDKLLKENGFFSYITPNNWLTINTNKKLRQFILAKSTIKIVNFYMKVFDKAAVDNAIVLFKKSNENSCISLLEYEEDFKLISQSSTDEFLNKNDFLINISSFKNSDVPLLIEKIELNSVKLNSISDVKVGIKAYQIGKGNPVQTIDIKNNRSFHSNQKLDDSYLQYFDGKNICRYFIGWSGEFLKYGNHLAEPRKNFALFSTKRILVRQIPSKLPYCINACLIEEIALNDLNSMNIINMQETPELILAVLNSKLISYWFFHKFGKMQRDTFPQFKVNELAIFPMPKTFEPYRENLVRFVTKIMAEKKAGNNTQELEMQIDTLVYALYGLSDAEIKYIETAL